MDLSNYAPKRDLKKGTGMGTSNLALKLNLVKLSSVVNNEFVTKAVYDKLVAKVNNIDTSGFV